MNYKVKEKISIKIECSLLVLCSSNLILCQEKRLQSLSFSGQLEKEWLFESPIRYIKTIGGVPRHESLLVGLKNGQIQSIFLHNMFQIDVIRLSHSIRCIDLNSKHQKIAVIDEKNKCFIYDLPTKQQLFEVSTQQVRVINKFIASFWLHFVRSLTSPALLGMLILRTCYASPVLVLLV